jgi:ribosomal protein S18 acetylase RimI-like enzyme
MASGTVLLHPDKQPAFFINEVSVVEDLRRTGIATALCERLLEVARAKGCKGVWLATEADNAEARALYRKLRARQTARDRCIRLGRRNGRLRRGSRRTWFPT